MLFLEEIRIIKRGEIQWSVFPLLGKSQHITESQNGWGWEGPLEVILSNPPAQAGSPRAGWQGSCPEGF